MRIIPQRLHKLRRDRRLSRKALAKLAHVSEKQIQRLEDPERASRNVRAETVTGLAGALGVEVMDLTGEPPTSDGSQTVRIGSALRPGVSLAYELIERRYRVSVGDLINMAPLLFAVLAEDSLAWRRAELQRVREANRRVQEFGDPRLRFTSHAFILEDDGHYEQDAIDGTDLFNDPFPANYRFEPDENWDRNPFADYLRMLVKRLEPDDHPDNGRHGEENEDKREPAIQFETYDYTGTTGVARVPPYSVCRGDLKAVAEPGSEALYALHAGDVRLSDIPEELKSPDAKARRQAWLEGKLSSKSTDWLELVRGITVQLPGQSAGETADTRDGGEA